MHTQIDFVWDRKGVNPPVALESLVEHNYFLYFDYVCKVVNKPTNNTIKCYCLTTGEDLYLDRGTPVYFISHLTITYDCN